MQRPEREQGLPKVPEALEQLRLPKDVQSMHQLMCSLIGLLFATTSAAHPDLGSYSEAAFATMTATQRLDAAHTLLVAGLLMGYVLLARWLLTRRISQAKYTRMFSLVFTFAAAMEGWDLYHLALAHDAPWRLIPAVCFLVFAPLWYWRNHKRLVFWFPQVDMEKVNNPIQQNARTSWQSWARPLVQILLRGPIHGVKRLNRGKQLGAKRNWHTLTWSSVHVFLWMFILVLAG